MSNARLHMHAVTVHTPNHPEGVLVVRIAVTCEVCGDHEIVVVGHHIKALQRLLQSVVDDVDPALVDGGEETIVYHRSAHQPVDPSTN